MPKQRPIDRFLQKHPDWDGFEDLIALPPTAREIEEQYPDTNREVLLRCLETHTVGTAGATRGAVYVRGRMLGEDPVFLTMTTLQSGPVIKTEATYLAGRKTVADDLGDAQMGMYRRLAKRYGFTPGPNDIYNPNLARRPGDPDAWMPPTNARSHVRNVCLKRGDALIREDGAEIVKPRSPDRDPYEKAPALAPDLVNANARRMLRKDPSLRKKKPQEIREMVLAKHGQQS